MLIVESSFEPNDPSVTEYVDSTMKCWEEDIFFIISITLVMFSSYSSASLKISHVFLPMHPPKNITQPNMEISD